MFHTFHQIWLLCSKENPVSVEGKGKEKAETCDAEAEPHKDVLEGFRFDSLLKWLVQSSAEDAQSLPQAQAKGVLYPQRGTRCPWLCCGWHGQRLLREGENRNRSRKSSSQVSPASAPPPAPPHGCSPLALVAKPVLPERQQSSNCTETHLPKCHCWLLRLQLGEGRWRDVPLHHNSLEEARGNPSVLHTAPQAFCSHLGSVLFRLQEFFYLVPFQSKRHLTGSGSDCSHWTTSPVIIPHYPRLTMQGPGCRNKGNRVVK